MAPQASGVLRIAVPLPQQSGVRQLCPLSAGHWLKSDGSMKFQELQNVSDTLNEEIRCWLESRTAGLGLVSELRKADQIKLQVSGLANSM